MVLGNYKEPQKEYTRLLEPDDIRMLEWSVIDNFSRHVLIYLQSVISIPNNPKSNHYHQFDMLLSKAPNFLEIPAKF